MLLVCSVHVWQQLLVWFELCVCETESDACLKGCRVGWVEACRDDGIGKLSLSLRPTAKPAEDTAAISSLSASLRLARSLTGPFFFSHSGVYPFHLFPTPLVIFALLLEPALLMFFLSCFLSPLFSLTFPLLRSLF